MTTVKSPPAQRVPMIDNNGLVTQAWLSWFQHITKTLGGEVQPDLEATIEEPGNQVSVAFLKAKR